MQSKTLTRDRTQTHKNFVRAWQEIGKREMRLTQETMAKKLGMQQASFSRYLTGVMALNTDIILAVCSIYKINPGVIDPSLRHLVVRKKVKMRSVPVTKTLSGKNMMENSIEAPTGMGDDIHAVYLDVAPEGSRFLKGEFLLVKKVESFEDDDELIVEKEDEPPRIVLGKDVTDEAAFLIVGMMKDC